MNSITKVIVRQEQDRQSIFSAFERFQDGSRHRSKCLLLREVWPALAAIVRELRHEGYAASVEEYSSRFPYPYVELVVTNTFGESFNLVFSHSYGGLMEVYENYGQFDATSLDFCPASETLSPVEVTLQRISEIAWKFVASALEADGGHQRL